MPSELHIHKLLFSLNEGSKSLPFMNLENLCFREGISILCGISGSGKTTFLEAICGMRPVERLNLVLDGNQFDYLDTHQRETFFSDHVSVQYQDPELLKELSCRENLQLFERLCAKPAPPYEFFLDVITELGIDGILEKNVTRISRGEAQRISLARALLYSQRVLILDEPLVYFQIDLRKRVWKLVQRLVKERSLICMMATHDPQFSTPSGQGALFHCYRDVKGLSHLVAQDGAVPGNGII